MRNFVGFHVVGTNNGFSHFKTNQKVNSSLSNATFVPHLPGGTQQVDNSLEIVFLGPLSRVTKITEKLTSDF